MKKSILFQSSHTEPVVAGAAPDSRLRGGQGIASTDHGTAAVFSLSISTPAASSSRQFSDIFGLSGKAAACGLELEQNAQVPNTERHMRLRLYP